jgi:hypothetical protein
MYRMLSFFDLAEGEDLASFEKALAPFCQHMIDIGMLQSRGPVGRRSGNTPMDTDEARSQQYMFVSTFADKAQCDASYAYIKSGEEPCASLHKAMESKMRNGIFSCWDDEPAES